MDSPAQQREPHLLNLKVMRLSRPTLAKHTFPFVLDAAGAGNDGAESEGVSGELRRALAEQRGAQPLDLSFTDRWLGGNGQADGIPARDLGITPMLMLPSSFGSINLGETFTGTLCVSNDAPVPVSGTRMAATMQSTSQTLSLGEAGVPGAEEGQAGVLGPAKNLEMMVSCDMKELGLHVLQCQVEYMSSSGPRHFSRSYRFNVTAPLNIKTKTHLASNPSMTLDPASRDLVFLEVHMQNVSGASMTMDKVELAPVAGMRLVKRSARRERRRSGKGSVADEDESQDSPAQSQLFQGAFETLAPGDTRQHLFTLAPVPQPPFPQTSLFPVTQTPGSVIPLGRLDLVWRGPFGERGQLLTSMLNRRVAQGALAPTRTASALAPQALQRPQSPAVHAMAGQGTLPPLPPPKGSMDGDAPWEVALSVLECPRKSMPLRKQMGMRLRVAIGRNGGSGDEAPVHLAIQYLQVVVMPPPLPSPSATGLNTPLSPPSRSATPVQGFQVNIQPPSRVSSPTISRVGSPAPTARAKSAASMRPSTPLGIQRSITPVPPPAPTFPPRPVLQVPAGQFPQETRLTGQVKQIGASLVFLPCVQPQLLEVAAPKRDESPRPSTDGGDPLAPPPPPSRPRNRVEGFVDAEIQLLATKPGLARLGGLRVLRLNALRDVKQGGEVLREWTTLGDIWVEGC